MQFSLRRYGIPFRSYMPLKKRVDLLNFFITKLFEKQCCKLIRYVNDNSFMVKHSTLLKSPKWNIRIIMTLISQKTIGPFISLMFLTMFLENSKQKSYLHKLKCPESLHLLYFWIYQHFLPTLSIRQVKTECFGYQTFWYTLYLTVVMGCVVEFKFCTFLSCPHNLPLRQNQAQL